MLKKTFAIFAVIISCFMLTACGVTNKSKIVETDECVYDFYYNNFLPAQHEIGKNIKNMSISKEDRTKVDTALNSLKIANMEELAIIAGVECYDYVGIPKERYLNIANGRVFVKQNGRHYICEIEQTDNGENKITNNFSFSISKDNTTNKYTINYSKNISETKMLCVSHVTYDKKSSYFNMDMETYDDATGKKYQTEKYFYMLMNKNKALRINTILGSDNNRSIYAIDTYKQIVDYKTKIASCNDVSGELDKRLLKDDSFVKSLATDRCGYLITYKNSDETPVIESFGNLEEW